MNRIKLGKTVILGDSYSTFEGFIPKGYAAYYGGPEGEGTGVDTVDKTWWKLLEKATDCEIILNESWSGTPICNTGYGLCDVTPTSFITRMKNIFALDEVDTVLIFGGTNDEWICGDYGETKYENITKEDLFKVYPAMVYMLQAFNEKYKNTDTKVFFIMNCDLNEAFTEEFRKICAECGVPYIKLYGIEKNEGHPTESGMIKIKDEIIEYMNGNT